MLTAVEVGRKPFHLDSIYVNPENPSEADLTVLFSGEKSVDVVAYDVPEGFGPIVEAMKEACPMHMVGFQEQDVKMYLANAASIWGHVCPCAE